MVCLMTANLLIATQWGSDDRVRAENRSRAFEEADLERQLMNLSRMQDHVNEFRETLGLTPLDFSEITQSKKDDVKKSERKKSK
jgi:hypothetical protein